MSKIIECIPNFSVSREKDPAAFQALVDTAGSIPGCTLFDVQSDRNHNRCVFTILGSPEAVGEAAFRLAEKAAEVIDLNKHTGQHPRMGATDVIPFVPQSKEVSLSECVELSKRVAKRIWEELKIPSFLYEESASREERRNLAACRKGEFEGMPEKLLREEWAPDFGERKVHPTAGIIAIGARMPLIAFNINLDTSDVRIAKEIAKAIRGSSGGFRYCKALGIYLEDRGIAQVSMNMVNYEGTPLYYAYEMVRALADWYGVRIIGSELVGLTPAKALVDCAEYYLKLENFKCHDQVIEYHLIDMNDQKPKAEDGEKKLSAMKLDGFTEVLASDAPAPGGGSAAALAGALGSALVSMVSALTLGKKKYEDSQQLAQDTIQKADALRRELTEAIDSDTAAFETVSAAFSMPKETDAEKEIRSAAIQKGLVLCTESPLHIMELSQETLRLADGLTGHFNTAAASDLGVSVLMLKTALLGAWLNVKINIGSLKDRALAAAYEAKGSAILEDAVPAADRLYQEIINIL